MRCPVRCDPLPAVDMKITQAHAQIVQTHGFVTLRKPGEKLEF